MTRIIIIGAGMGGLAAALSLHRCGFQPVIYEAAPQLALLGVGINVLPHAARELAELGLLEDLCGAGVEIDTLLYRDTWGRPVWQEPRGIAAGYRWPQVAIHRGELQMLLARAVAARLGPDAVRLGHALTDLETSARGVSARFANGETIAADLLIGADGIHSVVRRRFYPDEGPPKWRGGSLYRATTLLPHKFLGGRSQLWAGHAARKFVAYPIRNNVETGETLVNWICDLNHGAVEVPAPPRQDWNRRADIASFLPAFEAWDWPDISVPALIRGAREIYEFPMVDRDPVPRWSFGRATLLGDAAHPMYPIGSNGATQAIIDGRVLAWHLATAPSLEEGLAGYEAARRPATARIVEMNRANGPDQVIELANQRAPGRQDDLDALLPMAERKEIADGYKKIAGFDPATLNARPSFDPPAR
jgi:2-polyprenyl-6-methoxyphenol hydroxylase-like FAD-dependent oxidoreductase